jgi:uncharacterized cofD-like protein
MGRLLGAQGRVLPMSVEPLEIEAIVEGPDGVRRTIRGQVAVATAPGNVVSVSLQPEQPSACPQAVEAVRAADWVVLGPGSWFTSVIPHLLVPELASALHETSARRLVALNLAPQLGETSGFAPETYLEVLADHAPGWQIDVVLADPKMVPDHVALERVAAQLGARVVLAPIAVSDGTPRHDPELFASAYRDVLSSGRI